MNPQEPIQAKEDEITLTDILIFLQASFSNVVKSLVVCLLVGGAYYFSVPKIYEASATIEMATLAGVSVETPTVLLEKIKMPLYFSRASLQACGADGGLGSHANFADKIKPSINKPAGMISFVNQGPSSQEAKACLNAVIADISSNQAYILKPLLNQKKQKLNQLSEQLKNAEEIKINVTYPRTYNTQNKTQSLAFLLQMTLIKINLTEINDLQSKISSLEYELSEIQTRPTTLVNSVYSSEVSVNKKPLFIFGLCLALGVFLGLLVTVVMRVGPGIWQQIRDAGSRAR